MVVKITGLSQVDFSKGSGEQKLTVYGENFEPKAKIHVGPRTFDAKYHTEAELSVNLPGSVFDNATDFEVRVENPDGTKSNARFINVVNGAVTAPTAATATAAATPAATASGTPASTSKVNLVVFTNDVDSGYKDVAYKTEIRFKGDIPVTGKLLEAPEGMKVAIVSEDKAELTWPHPTLGQHTVRVEFKDADNAVRKTYTVEIVSGTKAAKEAVTEAAKTEEHKKVNGDPMKKVWQILHTLNYVATPFSLFVITWMWLLGASDEGAFLIVAAEVLGGVANMAVFWIHRNDAEFGDRQQWALMSIVLNVVTALGAMFLPAKFLVGLLVTKLIDLYIERQKAPATTSATADPHKN